MDHTPGQRQFADTEKMRAYIQGKKGLDMAQFDVYCAGSMEIQARVGAKHEAAAVAAARRYGATLASHDDTTAKQVAVSAALGVTLAEFPTTREAEQACRAAGIAVIMGAPNVIRGGSHSGNVAALDLARVGLLDILSSDYVPAALLTAAGRVADLMGDLPAAIAMVSATPAKSVGMADRGRIAPGLRADMARVARIGQSLSPRGVWVRGRRVS